MPEFRKNPAAQRYELLDDGQVIGYVTYEAEPDHVFNLTHTVIDPSRNGQGLGRLLVGQVLSDMRAQGARVIPTCSFIDSYMNKHPEVADLRAS